jgi:hypothetical protein
VHSSITFAFNRLATSLFIICVLSLLYPNKSVEQAPGAPAKPIAYFVDDAVKAGLTAKTVFGGVETKQYIIETTGTGVAIFDYDNDGWPDIFLVNGTTLDANPTASAPTNHL